MTAMYCPLVYPARLDLRLSHPLQCSLLVHEGLCLCVKDTFSVMSLPKLTASGAQHCREHLQVERDASLDEVKAAHTSMTELQISTADQLQQLQADLSTATAER